jgi:hypothetical protein
MDRLGDHFGGGRAAMQRKMAETFLQSDAAEAVLTILTRTENRLLEAVVEQHHLLDVDGPTDVPDPEDRAGRLRALWQAKIAGEFPAFWVEHYADLAHPEEAAQYADADPEEWQTTKTEWADRYRRNGMTGTDDELAGAHTKTRYDVGLDEFERVVVEWPDGREGDELQDVIAGPVETAITGIEQVNDHLREHTQA